jgi:anti-anti-sigma regulatory factor
MFSVELLRAREGDCIWIEYGRSAPVDRRIIVVDGGPPGVHAVLRRRIKQAKRERAAEQLHIDLIVVTHIDSDHIGGILNLLSRPERNVTVGDVWFNGVNQLSNVLGTAQGDRLSTLLSTGAFAWNKRFEGNRIAVVDTAAELPRIVLDGDMVITVLGPLEGRLWALARIWDSVAHAAEAAQPESGEKREDILGEAWPPNYIDDESNLDEAVANATSISLLLEYGARACLLAADANAADLTKTVRRLLKQRHDHFLSIDLFKVPHHGSAANVTSELLRSLNCRRYAISTSGAVHNHPNHQAILRVIKEGGSSPHLMFNYRTEKTKLWDERRNELPHALRNYSVEYGCENAGLAVQL